MSEKTRILAVDDEKFNLSLLDKIFKDSSFEVLHAEDGAVALNKLAEMGSCDAILLDRMMPNMDGIAVLNALKADARYRDIPIIMQTAAGSREEVEEGILAGAYYYLVKPYNAQVILRIVKTALQEARTKKALRKAAGKYKKMPELIRNASFNFRTLEEAAAIAHYIANCCPDSGTVAYGLDALMINAVEHGNLGISFDEKQQLVIENRWLAEVTRRVALPENQRKFATIALEALDDEIRITITDQGNGFRWKQYLDFEPTRMTEPNGRGIAITRAVCFPQMEYRNSGREVVCRLPRHAGEKFTQQRASA